MPVVAEGVPAMMPVFGSRVSPWGREGDTVKRRWLFVSAFTDTMGLIYLQTKTILRDDVVYWYLIL